MIKQNIFHLIYLFYRESPGICINPDKINVNSSSMHNTEKKFDKICSNEKLPKKISELYI